MIINQAILKNTNWEQSLLQLNGYPSIILMFVSPKFNFKEEALKEIIKLFPEASVIGCSTAGEILDTEVLDKSCAVTTIQFEKVTHKKVSVAINSSENSFSSGTAIAEELISNDLRHILLLSDGLNVNGADLVEGLKSNLPNISITGGLAGGSKNFDDTFVINNEVISDKIIVAVGLYGEELEIGYGSKGGWDSFGIERLVTKSNKNILYELDGVPALELYKSYLKEKADQLPVSGLLFPLSLRVSENSDPVVRTILAINEEEQSLTFAGNIPEGSYVRLMKANINRLIDGAEQSAKVASKKNKNSELAILISCVGRRLVLKQLVEEEVEAVRDVLGTKPKITGFYSFGEIGPFGEFSPCELHNQTMTITVLSEK